MVFSSKFSAVFSEKEKRGVEKMARGGLGKIKNFKRKISALYAGKFANGEKGINEICYFHSCRTFPEGRKIFFLFSICERNESVAKKRK